MRKLKYIFSFILILSVIVFCALLPWKVAAFQDKSDNATISYGDISEVQLEKKQLNMLEKLYLYCFGNTVEITDAKTNLKSEGVYEMVVEQLSPYVKSGLIFDKFSQDNFECYPIAFYEVGNIEVSTIIWQVSFFSIKNTYEQLWLSLDDETGKIISIGCEFGDEHLQDPEQALFSLVNIYFNNINEGETETFYPAIFYNLDYYYDGVGFTADAEFEEGSTLYYGSLYITFYVHSQGFYTWFNIYDAESMR